MARTLPASLAAAAILLGVPMCNAAHATMPAALPAAGAKASDAARVQLAAVVCGAGGCVRVQTGRVRHPMTTNRSVTRTLLPPPPSH